MSARRRPEHVSLHAALVVLVVFALALGVTVVVAAGKPERELGYGQVAYKGMGPERWAAEWRQEHRAVVRLSAVRGRLQQALRDQRRILLRRPQVVEAINLACLAYGYCATLWRKARCETGGTFDPGAANRSGASGLFQFLPSTWRSTPFARLSVWSPYANALAAGWMHANGRGGEWSCR